MDFASWMKASGLSGKSVDSYLGAINGRLSNWASAHQLTSKQIADIVDAQEFIALAEQLRETPEYRTLNVTGHGMYGAALNNYRKYLDNVSKSLVVHPAEPSPHRKVLEKISVADEEPFDPSSQEDGRARVLQEVVRRRGQAKFRRSRIAAYSARCAVSGCPVVSLLEAAHITPYLGPETNSLSNGLLLRADLHTLWDLGLIAIDPATQRVWVSPEVNDPTYQGFSGVRPGLPLVDNQRPSIKALEQQWDAACSQYVKLN